jgi:hypothetical protein
MAKPHPTEQMLDTNKTPVSGMDGLLDPIDPSSFREELDALEVPPGLPQKPHVSVSVPVNDAPKVSADTAAVASLVGPETCLIDSEVDVPPAPSSVESLNLQEINNLLGMTNDTTATPAPAPVEEPVPPLKEPDASNMTQMPSSSFDPVLSAMATITEAETPAAVAALLAAFPPPLTPAVEAIPPPLTPAVEAIPAPAPTPSVEAIPAPEPVTTTGLKVPRSIMTTPMMESILQKMALQPATNSSGGEKQDQPEVRQYIEGLPTELDVVLGRGGRSNHHAGNKQYRTEVENLQQWYNHSARSEKQNLSQCLVNCIQSYGGRFLKLDKDVGRWCIVSNSVARRKASQALREYVPMHERLARKTSAA